MAYFRIIIWLIAIICLIYIFYLYFKEEKPFLSLPGYKPRSLFGYIKNWFDLNYYSNRKKLYGTVSSISISIEEIRDTLSDEITIEIAAFLDFKIKEEMQITRNEFLEKLTNSAISTGDKSFDKLCYITTKNRLFAYAMLDYKIRKSICLIIKNNIKIKIWDNQISLFIPANSRITSQIKKIIENLILIAKDLNEIPDLKERIVYNILNDPHELVMLNNLYFFFNIFSAKNQENQQILKKLLKSKNLIIQIKAAGELTDKNRAVQHIINIHESLKKNDLKNKILCIKAFKNLNTKKSTDFLKKIYNLNSDKNIKIEILNTFYTMQEKSLSNFLVKKLTEEKKDICLSIVKTLATCGTKEAIEPLHKIMQKINNHNLIQETIRSIQKSLNLTDKHKGMVSIANPAEKEGGLSKAERKKDGGLSKA